MTPQGSTDRTLALPTPPHAIRTAVRSTAFRVACWVGGVALWIGPGTEGYFTGLKIEAAK